MGHVPDDNQGMTNHYDQDPGYSGWLTSKRFWTDTTERSIRTMAQTGVALLGAPLVDGYLPTDVDLSLPWQYIVTSVVLAGVLSVLTALAGGKTGDPSTASLTAGTTPWREG